MQKNHGAAIFQTFAQIADNADMEKVSAKIKDVKLDNVAKKKEINQKYFYIP